MGAPAPVLVGVGLGALALLVATLSAGGALSAAGASGWSTLLLPVVRLAAIVSAAATVGTLLFAAVLSPPRRGAAAAGAARSWALAWLVAAVVGAALTLSDQSGKPLTASTPAALVAFVREVDQGRALGVVLLLVTVVVAATGTAAGGRRLWLAMVCAAAAVVPPALTGHAAGDPLACASLALHVLASLAWVGGLAALVRYGRSPQVLPGAAARFSTLALGCFVAVVASGVLNAVLKLGPGVLTSAPDSAYVWLLTAKLVAVGALGVLGWWHRARTLPRLASDRQAFLALVGVELVVMLVAMTLAVALSRTPTPL